MREGYVLRAKLEKNGLLWLSLSGEISFVKNVCRVKISVEFLYQELGERGLQGEANAAWCWTLQFKSAGGQIRRPIKSLPIWAARCWEAHSHPLASDLHRPARRHRRAAVRHSRNLVRARMDDVPVTKGYYRFTDIIFEWSCSSIAVSASTHYRTGIWFCLKLKMSVR